MNWLGSSEYKEATWLDTLQSGVVSAKGQWFTRTLDIEPELRYLGRPSPNSDAHLFAREDFQAALIEALTTPGRARDFLLEEIKADRKKRRPSLREDSVNPISPNSGLKGILAAAIESGCGLELVSAILDKEYDPSTLCDRTLQYATRFSANTPVEASVCKGRDDILKELIHRGAKLDGKALRLAIDNKSSACIDVLLDNGVLDVRVNENRAATPPAYPGDGWSPRSSNRYCPILVYAAKQGDVATIEKLVNLGTNINTPSWNGDVISLFGSDVREDEISGEVLKKFLSLGVQISNQAALRVVRNGDLEAVKLLSDAGRWPSPEELTLDLQNSTSWAEASRLLEAGGSLSKLWKYSHPEDRVSGRYGRKVDTMTWLSNAFGPPPAGMFADANGKVSSGTHLPACEQSLVRRLSWEKLASNDPVVAATDPLCPSPAMAWRVLLEAGDQPPAHVLGKRDFFENWPARLRMDEALSVLASRHPVDLHARFAIGPMESARLSKQGVGERLLCGRWSTPAAMLAFEACGGATVPPEKGTWHGVVASHRPIRGEVPDARPARLLALDALGLNPTEQDSAVATKESLREMLTSFRAARAAQAVVVAPKSNRKHGQ